jgi:hypothetical protein
VENEEKPYMRLLAAGTEIDPHLTPRDGTLYWTQGGKPMSASLN